jgi:polyphosphate kinase
MKKTQDHLLNRELAWLYFNDRVLQQSEDKKIPLLERLRFLSIFQSNLDEFFMKRLSIIRADALKNKNKVSDQLWTDIYDEVQTLFHRSSKCFTKDLQLSLAEEHIHFLDWSDLTDDEIENITDYFYSNILPILTPLAVDPGHPFPHISALSTSLAVRLESPSNGKSTFARIKIPTLFPSFIPITRTTGQNWIHINQVIKELLHVVFPNFIIKSSLFFRVTRNIEFERDEEDAEDILEMISEELKERKFGHTVKFECEENPDSWLLDVLKDELQIYERDIFVIKMPTLDFGEFSQIFEAGRVSLKYPPWSPYTPSKFKNATNSSDLFKMVREGSVLLHHPYESYSTTIERFIVEASNDPDVIGIKLSLYRTNRDSRLVKALIKAIEKGKEVVCVIELKARFDEKNNIAWARKLEDVGAHIIYGIVGYKTHCKTALVTRKEEKGLQCYAHIGTGNYNADTANFYTDLGYLTCEPDITEDIVLVFNFLTGKSSPDKLNKLLVAPFNLREKMLQFINNEITNHKEGKPSGIILKINNLEDRQICDALFEAAEAGVNIHLAVRSICALKNMGLKNLRITSVVDQFLEHSRIYHFRNGQENQTDGLFYIGSADLMKRNLDRRVEVLTPVESLEHKQNLKMILDLITTDNTQAWEMTETGTYERIERGKQKAVNFQLELKRHYTLNHQQGN